MAEPAAPAVEAAEPLVPSQTPADGARDLFLDGAASPRAQPLAALRQRACALSAGACVLALAACAGAWARSGGASGHLQKVMPKPMDKMALKQDGCHDAVEDGQCYRNILYIKRDIQVHPESYPGLEQNSSFKAFQAFLHYQSKCPEPCWGAGHNASHEPHRHGPGSRHRLSKNATEAAEGNASEPANATSSDNSSQSAASKTADHKDDSAATKGDKKAAKKEISKEVKDAEEDAKKDAQKHAKKDAQKHAKKDAHNHAKKDAEEVEEDADDDTDENEKCEEVKHGSVCYENVRWVMKTGIFTHPEWYPKLSKNSSFPEVQAVLQYDIHAQCPEPCKCHTAMHGEMCHEKVSWVLQTGLYEHPEWFKGIDATTPREVVQRKLSAQDPTAGCPKPCKAKAAPEVVQAKPLKPPSLYCFTAAQTGDQGKLVKAQAKKKVGIFACDGFGVFSPKKVKIAGVHTITFEDAKVVKTKKGAISNAQLFMNVWQAVAKDGTFKKHDWTIKADPEAVLLPDRMRMHLTQPVYAGAADKDGPGAFVKNCGKHIGEGWPALFGSVVVVSQPAVKSFVSGMDKCMSKLEWKDWGEDHFMSTCFDQVLTVPAISDITLNGDEDCKGLGPTAGLSTGAQCWDQKKASYHPFATAKEWFACYEQASR